jgi:NDP-sugar pyrophosphorylase family protein
MAPLPALVLTAGLGTRLRPLSSVRAKPAMPVAGEPLVRRILRWLAGQGVSHAVLNLHHRPETICAVVGDGSDLGVQVRYSWENPILGSAGGPRRALPLLASERFLLLNGDTLTDLDLPGLERAHDRSGALVTLAVVPNRLPGRYGGVLVGDDGAVTAFVGRGSAIPSWHFIGVQVVEARAFAGLPADEPAESVGGLYPALIRRAAGSVRAWPCDAPFADIGTPADYLDTSLALAGLAATGASPPARQLLAGARCRIAESARVDRTILWDDVDVGDEASLVECVVGDAVAIPAGARWARRVIVRAAACEPALGDEIVDDLLVAPIDRAGRARGDGGPQPS